MITGKMMVAVKTEINGKSAEKNIVVTMERTEDVGDYAMERIKKLYQEAMDEGLSKSLMQVSKYLDTLIK